jgi:hypothetical protein
MLIATFGPTTAWVGTRITWADDGFALEGHGPISAGDVMEYDQQGHLLWVNEGARAWVGATASRPSRPRARTSTAVASPTAIPLKDETRANSTCKVKHIKRALLIVIIVLAVSNAVLLLAIAGVLHIP